MLYEVITLPPKRSDDQWIQVFRADGVRSDATELLAKARRPVIVAGMAATRAGASAALRALAESGGIPVTVSVKAKGT